MTTFSRVQGDVLDTVVAQLAGVADFTGATVEAHVWRPDVAPADLVASVTTDGICTVQLGSWLTTAAAGTWYIEYQVTFGDSSQLTWPAKAPDVITVRAQGA